MAGRGRMLSAAIPLTIASIVLVLATFAGRSPVPISARTELDGSIQIDAAGMGLSAAAGTFEAGSSVSLKTTSAAPQRLDGAVVSPIAEITASSQPRAPVELRVTAPQGFAPALTLIATWDQDPAKWTPLQYESRPSGELRIVVPHFSTIGTVRFNDVGDLVDALLKAEKRWVLEKFGVRTCPPLTFSSYLRTIERKDMTLLAVSVRDHAGGVILELCNPQSFYVEYRISGAHSENDLIAPGRIREIQFTRTELPSGASIEVLGTMSYHGIAAGMVAAVAGMVPIAGAFTGDLSKADVADVFALLTAATARTACAGSLRTFSSYFGCAIRAEAAVQRTVLRQAARVLSRAAGVVLDPDQLFGAATDVVVVKLIEKIAGTGIGPILAAWDQILAFPQEIELMLTGRAVSYALFGVPVAAPNVVPRATASASRAPAVAGQGPTPTRGVPVITPSSVPAATPSPVPVAAATRAPTPLPTATPIRPGPSVPCGTSWYEGEYGGTEWPTLYADSDYTGTCTMLSPGYWGHLGQFDLAGRVRSIRNPGNAYHITLYDQTNIDSNIWTPQSWQGTPAYFDESVRLLSGYWLDRAQAVKIERKLGAVVATPRPTASLPLATSQPPAVVTLPPTPAPVVPVQTSAPQPTPTPASTPTPPTPTLVASASLSAAPSTVLRNGSVTVSWSSGANLTGMDNISLLMPIRGYCCYFDLAPSVGSGPAPASGSIIVDLSKFPELPTPWRTATSVSYAPIIVTLYSQRSGRIAHACFTIVPDHTSTFPPCQLSAPGLFN